MQKSIFIVCVFNALLGTAFCVSCYFGTGDSYTSVDCGTGSDFCVKATMNGIVQRGCFLNFDGTTFTNAGLSLVAEGCSTGDVLGVSLEWCLCRGDNCNGSGRLHATLLLPLAVASITGLIMS